MLNELLEKEAESLTQAARYERSDARQGYRSGHYAVSYTHLDVYKRQLLHDALPIYFYHFLCFRRKPKSVLFLVICHLQFPL